MSEELREHMLKMIQDARGEALEEIADAVDDVATDLRYMTEGQIRDQLRGIAETARRKVLTEPACHHCGDTGRLAVLCEDFTAPCPHCPPQWQDALGAFDTIMQAMDRVYDAGCDHPPGYYLGDEIDSVRRALTEPAVPEAVRKVMDELQRARTKFPQWPDDPIHAAAVVSEEAGELAQAALQSVYEPDKECSMHDEAVQTAAMAIRFLENMQQYEMPNTDQHDDIDFAHTQIQRGGAAGRVPEGARDTVEFLRDSLREAIRGEGDRGAWQDALTQAEEFLDE